MPRMMLVVLLVFAVYGVSPSPAIAQAALSGVFTRMMTLDKNFDVADRNHDGLLSKDEAKAGHVPFIVKNFDAIDTQHRGQVSKDDLHDFIKKSLAHTPPAPASSMK